MIHAVALYKSSIGKKAIMAFTGFIGFGFVIGHMIGNLQVFPFFGGREAINSYAVFLRHTHGLLWVARAVLLSAVILHIVAAYQLTRMGQISRPIGYERWEPERSTYASRTMRWSGPILALFIAYHLLHFTFGTVHPNFIEGDVYNNIVNGFKIWYVSAFYIAAMIALGLHLYHGIWSTLQSVGLNNQGYNLFFRRFSAIFAVLIVIGNISIPLAVLFGFVS